LDNRLLATTEMVIAEDVFKDALSLFEHRNSKSWRKTSSLKPSRNHSLVLSRAYGCQPDQKGGHYTRAGRDKGPRPSAVLLPTAAVD
ncbi:MAG: hypothetical protein K2X58_00950, partial [Pseudomonadaceae bacterium]|nr:hypothetical protein [Pseudomonadaceae bacterium]